MPTNPGEFVRLRRRLSRFVVTDGDIAGPLLRRLGQIHRKQELLIFSSEGASGARGRWTPLSPAYLEKKIRLLGRPGSILVLSGELRERFTKASRPQYIQRYVKPRIQFGARSAVGRFHFTGSSVLPRRDPVSKQPRQVEELRRGVLDWWRLERVPQILRSGR